MTKQIKSLFMMVIAMLAAFLIFWLGVTIAWNWPEREEIRDVSHEVSPDGEYQAVLQQVGEPDWPFGSTYLRVIVKKINSNRAIETIETSVQDDGANLSERNWQVEWHDAAIKITLKGSEQQDVVYTIALE